MISKYNSRDELISYIGQFPIITREKERWEFAKGKDKMDRELIINSNLRAVYSITDKICNTVYSAKQYDWLELFNTGVMGLNRAIDKFDATYNNRFQTYAHRCIWGYIMNYVNKVQIVKNSTTCSINDMYDITYDNLNTTMPNTLPNTLPNYSNTNISNLSMVGVAKYMDIEQVVRYIKPLLRDCEDLEVFCLYYFNGCTTRQIGAYMGHSRRHILYRLSKIQLVLRNTAISDNGYLHGLLKGNI